MLTDDDELSAAADDFGHLVSHRPHAVVPVTCVDDVLAAVAYAREHDLPIMPRGAGHSTAGQSQSLGAVVLDMRGLDTIGPIQDDRIVVGAGATWHTVTETALTRGLAPPVLTDYIELTVGGTLSVGGVSGATHQHGLQTDNVVELHVITDDGQAVSCSRNHHPDLFDRVRAGRGRHGVITHATLNLVPAAERTRVHHAYYSDLRIFLRDQDVLMRSKTADYVEGHAKPIPGGWWYRIEAAFHYNPPHQPNDGFLSTLSHDTDEITECTYWEFANRLAEGERLLRGNGHWTSPHLWTNHLLPADRAAEVIDAAMCELTADAISESGTVIIYPFPQRTIGTPGFRQPSGDTTVLFAVLRTVPPDHPISVEAMQADNDGINRMVIAAGGTNYLDPIRPVGGSESRER